MRNTGRLKGNQCFEKLPPDQLRIKDLERELAIAKIDGQSNDQKLGIALNPTP